LIETRAAALHLCEDVIAGAVEDTEERADFIAGDTFAENTENGDAARDAGFHGEVRAGADGALPQVGAAQRHQFLVRGDHGFFAINSRFQQLARGVGAADELGHDVHFGVVYQLAPVGGAEDVAQCGGDLLGVDGSAANSGDAQGESELEGDLAGVLGKNRERPAADVAESDDSDIHLAHISIMWGGGCRCLGESGRGAGRGAGAPPYNGHMLRIVVVMALFTLGAQERDPPGRPPGSRTHEDGEVRLPNGKLQRDEILKADYEKNLEDARALLKLSEDLKLEIEKDEAFVLSISAIKKTEEIEKIAKRIRGRIKR